MYAHQSIAHLQCKTEKVWGVSLFLLIYQTQDISFVANLEATPTSLVQRFMGLYNPADNIPVVVAATQITAE
jgi:hypothetical protein